MFLTPQPDIFPYLFHFFHFKIFILFFICHFIYLFFFVIFYSFIMFMLLCLSMSRPHICSPYTGSNHKTLQVAYSLCCILSFFHLFYHDYFADILAYMPFRVQDFSGGSVSFVRFSCRGFVVIFPEVFTTLTTVFLFIGFFSFLHLQHFCLSITSIYILKRVIPLSIYQASLCNKTLKTAKQK